MIFDKKKKDMMKNKKNTGSEILYIYIQHFLNNNKYL